MKYLIYFVLIALGIFQSCKPKANCGDLEFNTPEAYLSFIQFQQNKIDSAMLLLSESFETGSDKNIRNRYRYLVSTCDSVLLQTYKLSGYDSDENLKDAAINLFSFYNGIFHHEYLELLEILQHDELPGSNEKIRASLILNSVKVKEDSLKKLFHTSILQFVDRNK